jgi:hypothetical protein
MDTTKEEFVVRLRETFRAEAGEHLEVRDAGPKAHEQLAR